MISRDIIQCSAGKLALLNWDDLRYLLAVIRHGSLAAAAKQLRVTQSTVGRRIVSMQEGLGVKLLNRTADGYVPTIAGSSVLSHIERIEAEALAVERAVKGLDDRQTGVVRVAGPDFLSNHVLIPCIATVQQTFPGIQIETVPEADYASPTSGDPDIVTRLRRFDHPDLVIRSIGTIAFGFYACPAYLLKFGQLDFASGFADQRLISLMGEQGRSAQQAWLTEHCGQAEVVYRADNYETQYRAASNGIGLALLPRFLADAAPDLQRLTTPTPIPPANIWLGVYKEGGQIPRIRAVLDAIVDGVRSRSGVFNPKD